MITSTFSTSAEGIVFRSTDPFGSEGCRRFPSTSTSVRGVPMPLKSTLAWPPLAVKLALVEAEEEIWGRVLRTFSSVGDPEDFRSSAPTVTIGVSDT